MLIRTALVLMPAIVLAAAALPRAVAAQDAQGLLDAVRQNMGKQLPQRLTITAAGSGFAPASGSKERQQYRIERFTQQIDVEARTMSERVVRGAAAGASGGGKEDTRDVTAGSSWAEQHALWTNPLGFLTGAASGPATVKEDTLYGTPYQVVTFTPANGQPVHGYVTKENVLERTRTEVDKVPVESVFLAWQDFNGLKYPSLIIQKQDGELARILVVSAVGQPASDAVPKSAPAK